MHTSIAAIVTAAAYSQQPAALRKRRGCRAAFRVALCAVAFAAAGAPAFAQVCALSGSAGDAIISGTVNTY